MTTDTLTTLAAPVKECGTKPKHNTLPLPPSAERPAWARKDEPSRDPGMRTLFHDECARADALWHWLAVARGDIAGRARKGYAFLSEIDYKPDPDDVDLYQNLLRWVAWCDSAYWLLTHWYGDDIEVEPCESLVIPFSDFPTDHYASMRVVRRLTGLQHEVLMEDAVEIWRAASIRSGYLQPVGMPHIDGSTPEGGDE